MSGINKSNCLQNDNAINTNIDEEEMMNDTTWRINFSDTSNSTAFTPWYVYGGVPRELLIFQMTIESITFVAAILANSLVVISYVRTHELRDIPSNIFILSLAVVDLTTAVFSIPLTTLKKSIFPLFWEHLPMEALTTPALCTAMVVMQAFPIDFGYKVLLIIAVDRFISVVFPLRHLWMMTHRKCICSVVAAAFFQALSFVLLVRNSMELADGKNCIMLDISSSATRPTLAIVLTIVPIAAMYSLHAVVGVIAFLKSRRAMSGQVQRESKVTSVMLRLVVLSAFCNIPMIVSNVILGSQRNELWVTVVRNLSLELAYINSALNPVIYAKSNSQFRKAFNKLLRRGNTVSNH